MKTTDIAKRLQAGETVQWRPHGHSMKPKIKSGQLVTIIPATMEDVEIGDIVFSKVHGRFLLHLVKQKSEDGKILIANNHGHVNGWSRQVFGKVVKIED